MKKLFKFVLFLAAAISVTSCGGGSSSDEEKTEKDVVGLEIEPETTAIKGGLGDCFTVVDKKFKISKDGTFTILAVEVERNDEPSPFYPGDICFFPNAEESGASMLGGFGYELLDEDGNVIAKGSPSSSATVYSWDDVEEALKSRSGETSTIRFRIDARDLSATPKKIRITSELSENNKTSKQEVADYPTIADAQDDAEEIAEAESDEFEESVKDVYNTASTAVSTAKELIKAEKAALDLVNSMY